MKVFIDTRVFIALLVKRETFHLEVVEKYHDYKNQKANFYTSDYVLDELLTWFVSHLSASNTKKIVTATAKNLKRFFQTSPAHHFLKQ